MKPKSSGLPNDEEDDVVSFGSDEATMIRPRSVLDDAFDARTVVQIGNKNQFNQNIDSGAKTEMGQRFGEETPIPPKVVAPVAPAPAPSSASALPEPPPNIEVKRIVPQAPPMDSQSMANAVTGKKLRKDLSAGTNTNFPIPKMDHPAAEPTSEMKMEIKPEMKRTAAPAPAPTPVPSAPSPIMNQIPAPIEHKVAPAPAPAPKREAKPVPAVEAKVEAKSESKSERKAEPKPTHEAHNDDKRTDKDDPFGDIPNDVHFEPQRRAFPKKIVAAAVALLAVVAHFVFGGSSSAPDKPAGNKEMASAEEPARTSKKKLAAAPQKPASQQPSQQEQSENQGANVPVANVSGGAQAVLAQFGESFNKTQGRTRGDTQAD